MLQEGQPEAGARIWARYEQRLTRVARKLLAQRRVADEEDIVVCAFASFLRGVESGRFARLGNRNDLWQVLVMLTQRRAVDQLRADQADKRGGGKVRGNSGFTVEWSSCGQPGPDQFPAAEPAPDFEAELSEQVRLRYEQLADDRLEAVARARLEGYSNKEIAGQLGTSVSSVERKLRLIRQIWGEVSDAKPTSD